MQEFLEFKYIHEGPRRTRSDSMPFLFVFFVALRGCISTHKSIRGQTDVESVTFARGPPPQRATVVAAPP